MTGPGRRIDLRTIRRRQPEHLGQTRPGHPPHAGPPHRTRGGPSTVTPILAAGSARAALPRGCSTRRCLPIAASSSPPLSSIEAVFRRCAKPNTFGRAPTRRAPLLTTLVLERNLHLGSVRRHLSIFDLQVEL